MSDATVKMSLTLKTVNNILRNISQNTFGIQKSRLLSGFIECKSIP